MDINRMIFINRLMLLTLLGFFALAVYLFKRFKPEGWELPERWESVSYSEDIPEWIMRTAKEDLDWGHGVGHFPEFPIDDENREGEKESYTGLTPQRRLKTLMTLETLAASIIIILIFIIIFS